MTSEINRHSKLALMKKGLRLVQKNCMEESSAFKTCPDEEGIKTQQRCDTLQRLADSKLALMKKGLRLYDITYLENVVSFKTCPDEEGIKTREKRREPKSSVIQNLP